MRVNVARKCRLEPTLCPLSFGVDIMETPPTSKLKPDLHFTSKAGFVESKFSIGQFAENEKDIYRQLRISFGF